MLVGDVTRLDKRVDNLGKHFDLAQKDVQEIKTSTGKISNRGRRIEDYDVATDEVKTVVSSPQDLLSAANNSRENNSRENNSQENNSEEQ